MKKVKLKYGLLLILLIGCIATGKSQHAVLSGNVKNLVEKTGLITEREMYCVDEKILFSAFNLSSPELRKIEWSNVLYVELIAPDGQVVARKKCSYAPDGTSGTLRIPTGTLTGNYYLRAYTRWMRDFSPYHYFYKLITVINPFRPELLEPPGGATSERSVVNAQEKDSLDVRIEAGKSKYLQREQVNLKIKFSPKIVSGERLTVSVIPAGLEKSPATGLPGSQDLKFSPDFIPETRGLSVSGKVVSENDSVPVPYTLVGLTIFKDKPETRNVRTNEKGQFFFDLSKLEGEYEIFISAKTPNGKSPLILVDNDFSTTRVNLPYVPVDLSLESKNVYQSLAFVSQMRALYRQQQIEKELKSFSHDTSFYGAADFVLKLADFVALPSVREYFYELVPSVRVKHEGKRSALKVLGPYSELGIYEPLALVDMVPIFDIDKVLALQPEKIDRIEVVTLPYVRGDIVFGGIVSLFSKKGDLAGIDLPSTGRFINYSMLAETKGDLELMPKGGHTPEISNCLYWNPAIEPDQSGIAQLSFSTGDNSGDFLIVVKGIGVDGKEKVAIHRISVE